MGWCARDAEDAVAVEVFSEWVEGELAGAVARGDERDLGVEGDHAFEDAGDFVDGGPGVGGLVGGGDAELAFAVVAEAAGFEDGGEADFADGSVERDEVVDGGEGSDLEAAVEEEVFFEEAVLRGGDGARVGEEGRPWRTCASMFSLSMVRRSTDFANSATACGLLRSTGRTGATCSAQSPGRPAQRMSAWTAGAASASMRASWPAPRMPTRGWRAVVMRVELGCVGLGWRGRCRFASGGRC